MYAQMYPVFCWTKLQRPIEELCAGEAKMGPKVSRRFSEEKTSKAAPCGLSGCSQTYKPYFGHVAWFLSVRLEWSRSSWCATKPDMTKHSSHDALMTSYRHTYVELSLRHTLRRSQFDPMWQIMLRHGKQSWPNSKNHYFPLFNVVNRPSSTMIKHY